MMEDVYGLRSTAGYSDYHPPQMALTGPDYEAFVLPPSTSIRDRIPVFGTEPVFSVSSAVSDENPIRRSSGSEDEISSLIRVKITSHPLYPKLLQAYIDCQKVGAPPEIANLLDENLQEKDLTERTSVSTCLGDDPELDEFMEVYCDVLAKYKSDLARPFDEATTFLGKIECQLRNLCNGASSSYDFDGDAAGPSQEYLSNGGIEIQKCDQTSEGHELKDELLLRYSGYIRSLKNEFSKKKKRGKLPKEARQILLNWWTVHYKWPYPTEADKVSLAVSTGLDQKQINNWFINQRKRHWKPSENMQFAVMDNIYGPFSMNN